MKIIITENKLEKVLKQYGTDKAIQLLGGWDNFCQVFKIESPMDFLHLFDDLEVFQSTKNPNFLLYRYRPGKNIMIYNIKENRVVISDKDILTFITSSDLFSSSPEFKPREIIQTWLEDVYNLDVAINIIHAFNSWDNVCRIE